MKNVLKITIEVSFYIFSSSAHDMFTVTSEEWCKYLFSRGGVHKAVAVRAVGW